MRLLLMQIHESVQDLFAPSFDHLQSRCLYSFDIFPETPPGDHLCYKRHLLLLLVVPRCYKVYYVLMFKLFDQLNLGLDSLSLFTWQPVEVDDVPGYLSPRLIVNAIVHDLICAASELLPETLEPTLGGDLNDEATKTLPALLLINDLVIVL